MQVHVRPGERNPIEGKFDQTKTAYGLNRIKARLMNTSKSWIASIILELNLVKLAGLALPCLLVRILKSFSASVSQFVSAELEEVERKYTNEKFKISKSQQVKFKMVV